MIFPSDLVQTLEGFNSSDLVSPFTDREKQYTLLYQFTVFFSSPALHMYDALNKAAKGNKCRPNENEARMVIPLSPFS